MGRLLRTCRIAFIWSAPIVVLGVLCWGQSEASPATPKDTAAPEANQPPAKQDTTTKPDDVNAKLDEIRKILKNQQQDSDFSLVLGIGSLLLAPGVTDYQNQSNVLNAAHLGKATPQLLTGISFRSKVPSLFTRFRCATKPDSETRPVKPGGTKTDKTADEDGTCWRLQKPKEKDENGKTKPPVLVKGAIRGELWQRNPWNAFVSIKFAPGASNPINGYVIGGSFSIAHHLDALVGFALTPVSEPAPGFRSVAAQFVRNEQKNGLYATFNPTAMLNNSQDAFDGFPTTNPATGALIYPGNPLTTHYRGGVVIGVSLPIAFSSFLKGSSSQSTNPAPGGTAAASAKQPNN